MRENIPSPTVALVNVVGISEGLILIRFHQKMPKLDRMLQLHDCSTGSLIEATALRIVTGYDCYTALYSLAFMVRQPVSPRVSHSYLRHEYEKELRKLVW
jgi:hypothetical protein